MKHRKEVHFHLHHPYRVCTSDIGIADEETSLGLFVITRMVTLGEVCGIVSAATVNCLVNSRAMTGTDSDFAAGGLPGGT